MESILKLCPMCRFKNKKHWGQTIKLPEYGNIKKEAVIELLEKGLTLPEIAHNRHTTLAKVYEAFRNGHVKPKRQTKWQKLFDTKPCDKCGNIFQPMSGIAKYCKKCRYEVLKERSRKLSKKRYYLTKKK